MTAPARITQDARPNDVLPALEFNALHCGDAIARVYFKQAAEEIRRLRLDLAHVQRLLLIEQSGTNQARLDAKRLERELQAMQLAMPRPARLMLEGDL